MPPGRLTLETESLAPGSSSIDEPAPISFLPTLVHPRPFTSLIPPNLPTYSESSSPSPPLIPPKWFSVKIEEVEDVKDKDIKMYSLSPPSPEASSSQYTPSQVSTIIPQKRGSDLQLGEDIPPLRYSLRRSTHETRVLS